MDVFSSGFLKILPQCPQRALTLEDEGIQQGYSATYWHPIITFVLAI